MKTLFNWIRSLSLGGKILLGLGVIVALTAVSGPNNNANVSNAPKTKTPPIVSPIQPTSPVITTKLLSETQVISFSSSTIDDATLAKGTTKVTTTGVNGSETLNYEITYKDGKQTDKKLLGTVVDTQPINQVTSVGTYVAPTPTPTPAPTAPTCSNGSYVNSAGDTVCSPSYAPSTPAGATAICRDGTYSFSQSRRGTCSYHDGVAQWL